MLLTFFHNTRPVGVVSPASSFLPGANTACLLPSSSNSSALHLLARLQRRGSIGHPPYEDLGSKTLMKASFQRFFTA